MVRAKLTTEGDEMVIDATSKKFDLGPVRAFMGGFFPAGQKRQGEHLHLAFVPPGAEQAVGVCVDGLLASGAPLPRDVVRMLSLDVDASGLAGVAERDPVAGRVIAMYPGLRPVLFATPFEAAVWCVLSTRIQARQAGRIRDRMAEQMGEEVHIHGDVRRAFPAPSRLAGLESFPGLFGRKPEYVRELAVAARRGALDADRLRALQPEEALSELRKLPGIGQFGSELILIRGCGAPDVLPRSEPRVLQAAALAYGWDEPSFERFEEVSEAWRPYRSWMAFFLRKAFADERLPL